MKELEILIKMQQCDDIIGEKEILMQELPRELSSIKNDLEKANIQLSETEQKLEENITMQKLKELDIQSNIVKINKYKEQLLTIKTNKEYKALNSEVSHLENKNSETDDILIELMEEEANIRTQLTGDKRKQEIADGILKANEEKLNNKIKQVQKEIEQIRDERNEFAAKLPRQILKRYASLIKNKNRKAVVFNENNACSGCGFNIRPQLVIEINNKNRLVNCESCGRILVAKLVET